MGGGRQFNNQRLHCYDYQGRARFDVEDVDELVLALFVCDCLVVPSLVV